MDGEHLADQGADAAIADDDDAMAVVVGRRGKRFRVERPGGPPPRQRRAETAEQRDRHHRQRHRDQRDAPIVAADYAAGDRGADHHEGEFAARPDQQRRLGGDPVRRAEEPRQHEHDRRLDDDQPGRIAERRARPRDEDREIEFGADRDEEQAEQQALERLDRHLDLAAELGLGEQQPGDEGAERHRQAAGGGSQRRAQHHQQAGGHEEFRAAGQRDRVEQRPQHHTADNNDGRERQRGGRQRQGEALDQIAAHPAAGEQRHHHQQRRDGEILQEQRREAQPTDWRAEPLAFGQHRNDDRGRGQRQRRADRRRRRRRLAERIGRQPERPRAQDELRQAEFEHQPPHALEALEREFEADGEEQDDDAEFGEMADRFDIGQRQRREPWRALGELTQAERPERDASQQKARAPGSWRRRTNSGATTPAVARNSSASL